MKSVLFKHRSIRKFRPTPIPEEVLRECLEAASRASTCGNMQLYSLVVTRDETLRERLAPCHFNQPMVRQAPCVVTVCADIHRFTMWCEQRDADPAYDNFAWFLNASTDALLAAQNGKSDMVMAGVTVTDERLKVMDFSDTYAEGIQSIIVKEDSTIASPDDLADKMIGTQRGTTGYIYCTDDFGEDNVIAYDDGLTAVQALNNGQVDAVVIDNAPAKEFVEANPGLKILDTAYAQEDYAIGVAKGNTELLNAINGALEELKADGTLQAIVDKYINAE